MAALARGVVVQANEDVGWAGGLERLVRRAVGRLSGFWFLVSAVCPGSVRGRAQGVSTAPGGPCQLQNSGDQLGPEGFFCLLIHLRRLHTAISSGNVVVTRWRLMQADLQGFMIASLVSCYRFAAILASVPNERTLQACDRL